MERSVGRTDAGIVDAPIAPMGRSSRRPGIYPDLRAIRQRPCFSRFGLLTGIIISVIVCHYACDVARAQHIEGMGRARARGIWTRLLPLLFTATLPGPPRDLLEASSYS